MSVELRPLGVKCNIQCQYCYQNPQRDAGNVAQSYDMEKMKAAVEKEGGSFTLFGGEALMVPEDDLEELWSWGYQKFGQNGVQTNGTLINDNHVRMFKKYRVHVGISVDGPGALNDVRWAGSLRATREATARTHAAIERLCGEGIPPSLIVTLHRGNATQDKLPLMHDWFRYVQSIGVTSARLHILEVEDDSVRQKYVLTIEENMEAFLSFARLEKELKTLSLDKFEDMRRLLLGNDGYTTCVWNACDPYTTRAVRGVEGTGQRSNCGRTNKDGIDYTKSDTESFERYMALYHTPQDAGGCNGCRFFLMCKGQCPGTAIDGDWRNRTEYCELFKQLFRHVEEELIDQGHLPISVRPERKELEQIMLSAWVAGQNLNIAGALSRRANQGSASSQSNQQSGYGHGDSHGDHTDSSRGRTRGASNAAAGAA